MQATVRRGCRVLLCVLLWPPAAASAQTVGGVRPELGGPRGHGALTAFRTTFDVAGLAGADADEQFDWEADLRIDVDLFDVGIVRGNLLAGFETVVGSQLRDVDPNQTNYVTDVSVFVRLPRGELGATFHHVSRHLADRADRGSVSWNMVGVSYGERLRFGPVRVDAGVRGMGTVERAGVDYAGQFEWWGAAEWPLHRRAAIVAAAEGVVAPVDRAQYGRGARRGGQITGGVRIPTGVGAVDLLAAWESRIDADPFARDSRRWLRLGLRLTAPAP